MENKIIFTPALKFIVIVSVFAIGIIWTSLSDRQPRQQSNIINNADIQTEVKPEDPYQKGLGYYNTETYTLALRSFEEVTEQDSNYASAQEYMKDINAKFKRWEKEAKENKILIERYQKKYNKLTNSGLYLYQIEQRLQKDGFYLKDSQFEKAPDGSNGLRRYFTKEIDGIIIDIWLQSAYSVSSYYTDVRVYSSNNN